MEWSKNLSNAIEYIEDNLDKEISYEEAAHIACCGAYYFQRLFSYVALKYGYTSPTSFNRAFQSIRISLAEDMEENQRTVPGFWKETLGKKQFSDICLLSDENPKGILGISVYHDLEKQMAHLFSVI